MSIAAALVGSTIVAITLAIASGARSSSTTTRSTTTRRSELSATTGTGARPAITNPRALWPSPVWVPTRADEMQRLFDAACDCLGEADPLTCVWQTAWPGVPAPPLQGDHLSVREAWAAARGAVAAARELGCAGLTATGPRTAAAASLVRSLLSQVPMPGALYQCQEGDYLPGDDPQRSIVWQALYNGTFAAALGDKLTELQAHERALAVASDPQARARYEGAIQCGWNAQLYGSLAHGPEASPALNDLAVVVAPIHDAVLERLLAGEAPIRTIALDSPSGVPTGAGSTPPLLWLPAVRRDALTDPLRRRQVDTSGLVWSDGSSKLNPPPPILALGVLDVPAGVDWGCHA